MTTDLKAHQQSIVRYYEETRLDYRILWLNRKNRAVHFGYFDEHIHQHDEALENLNRVMARTVAISAEDIVLDAGCGQGGSSVWLAAHTGAQVAGITLVPHQVKIATREAAKRGIANAQFRLGDYCSTGFPDNHFSVVWACESLCHTQDKSKFYEEAMRILKPGGRLVIAEYIRCKRPLAAHEEALLSDWLHRWSITDVDTWQEHEQHMQEAGFSNIQVRDCTENVKPSLSHLHSMSEKLLPLGKFLRRFGLRNTINHGNHVGSINQYKALLQGLWFYGIFSASKPE